MQYCRHVGTSPVGPVLAGPLISEAKSEEQFCINRQ